MTRKRYSDGNCLKILRQVESDLDGYRKICEFLQVKGRSNNHKKVERIWREEGLQLPARHRRRKRLYHHNASIIRLRPYFPNHVW
jgi:transposase InsO family protein